MKIYSEITPLGEESMFVVQKHEDAEFKYPVHLHAEFELNLVLNCSGNRIVGDSVNTYYDNDLVLLGPNLYHKWEKNTNDSSKTTVITLQFNPDIANNSLVHKKSFKKIKLLLENSSRGISFGSNIIKEIQPQIEKMINSTGFDAAIEFLKILNYLGGSDEYEFLTSVGFSSDFEFSKSKRIHKVYDYLVENYNDDNLSLKKVAELNNMSESAFSIFFKKRTNKNFTQFVIDYRISKVIKELQESNDRVKEIAFRCGFNNLSNFNRAFKKRTGYSPKEYRDKVEKINVSKPIEHELNKYI